MRKKDVILIDDDDNVTNFLNKTYLSSYDKTLQITVLTDTQEALKNIQEGCPLAIFLDINMPGMDGWEFLEECQKLGISCKIFILSSSIDPADINRSKEYPLVSKFFSKPLTGIDLEEIM